MECFIRPSRALKEFNVMQTTVLVEGWMIERLECLDLRLKVNLRWAHKSEANFPNLIADINYLGRVQHLTKWLMRGPVMCHMRNSLASSTSFHLNAGVSKLISSWSSNGEIDLIPSDFFFRPPRPGLREHTHTHTEYCGAFSVNYWNSLLAFIVMSPSAPVFKKQLNY